MPEPVECPVSSFEVKGFKSLLDVHIELGQVNVFIGANGSGKTNLLEALGLLSAAASGEVTDSRLTERGVRLGTPRLYKSSFRDVRIPGQIEVAAHAREPLRQTYRVGLHNPLEAPRPAWRYKTELWEAGEGKDRKIAGRSPASKRESDRPDAERYNPEKGLAALESVRFGPDDARSLFLRRLERYAIYTPTTPLLRGEIHEARRAAVGLRGGALADAALDCFAADPTSRGQEVWGRVLDLVGWASDLLVTSRRFAGAPEKRLVFEDRYMRQGARRVSAQDASEGALLVVLAAVLAEHPDAPPLLAIDNFDHGLNPRLVEGLTNRFCEWIVTAPGGRQVLLTTHSPLALDGLDLYDDRVRLFTVARTVAGRTAVRRVQLTDRLGEFLRSEAVRRVEPSSEVGEFLRAHDWPLSRLWIEGYLGGIVSV